MNNCPSYYFHASHLFLIKFCCSFNFQRISFAILHSSMKKLDDLNLLLDFLTISNAIFRIYAHGCQETAEALVQKRKTRPLRTKRVDQSVN